MVELQVALVRNPKVSFFCGPLVHLPPPPPSGWTERAVTRVGALLQWACGRVHAHTMAAKSVEQAPVWVGLSFRWLWFETQKSLTFLIFLCHQNPLLCPTKSAILRIETELSRLAHKRLFRCEHESNLEEAAWIDGLQLWESTAAKQRKPREQIASQTELNRAHLCVRSR